MKSFVKVLLVLVTFFPVLPATAADEKNFLVITDIHLNHSSTHAMEISPRTGQIVNDLDNATFEKILFEIDNKIKLGQVAKPNFILLLGDLVGHLRWFSKSALENEVRVFKLIKDTFPATPILYVFGNNDSLLTDYGPFYDSEREGQFKTPFDVAKSAGWINGFLSTGLICADVKNAYPCLITEDKFGGYYSAFLNTGLRFIVLNSIMFSPKRKRITELMAMQQLKWLDNQLVAAENNKESVLIAMHIPPGKNTYSHADFWLPKEQSKFLRIIKNHQKSIIGILASHTHAEEIKIIKDAAQNIIAGVYYVASLSTSHGNGPSVKTFFYEKKADHWALTNYESFRFSLEGSRLLLFKLYDYQSYYCTNQEQDLSQCLGNVTAAKMNRYYAAGNPNYRYGSLAYPEDIFLNF